MTVRLGCHGLSSTVTLCALWCEFLTWLQAIPRTIQSKPNPRTSSNPMMATCQDDPACPSADYQRLQLLFLADASRSQLLHHFGPQAFPVQNWPIGGGYY